MHTQKSSQLLATRSSLLPDFARYIRVALNPATPATFHKFRRIQRNDAMAQKVQLQLKQGEQQDKADDSPVTIADYGIGCLSKAHANS